MVQTCLYLRVKVVLMERTTKSLSPRLTCTSSLYKASFGEGGREAKGNICPPPCRILPPLEPTWIVIPRGFFNTQFLPPLMKFLNECPGLRHVFVIYCMQTRRGWAQTRGVGVIMMFTMCCMQTVAVNTGCRYESQWSLWAVQEKQKLHLQQTDFLLSW